MPTNRIATLTCLALFAIGGTQTAFAKEFNVECSSFEDCMQKGDLLTKKRKLSLALEAYRNSIKFDVENKDAWRKFEKIVVRISEEGGC